jgi:hypothetical protein
MIWGQVNLENVSKAAPPHEAIRKFSTDGEIMFPMVKQVMIMLMGIFGQAGAGLCEFACRTDSACKQLL